MLNKRGGVDLSTEQTGASIIEFLIFIFIIASIILVVINSDNSVDVDSSSSFSRLDGVIRERALVVGSEDVVLTKLDSDYALVLFGKELNSCEGKKILKPENKCKDRACLCLCEIEGKSEMCLIGSSMCLTYVFDFTEDCSYFSGKSSSYTLNVMNLKGNISVSTERIVQEVQDPVKERIEDEEISNRAFDKIMS